MRGNRNTCSTLVQQADRRVRARLAPANVETADALGWASDALEAQAFGFLAARGLKGLPLSYPKTTGVPVPMTGGVIARP